MTGRVLIATTLAVLASALVAAATVLYAVGERRHWSEMTASDYVALLEGDEGVTWA